jgi:hypothetical protein
VLDLFSFFSSSSFFFLAVLVRIFPVLLFFCFFFCFLFFFWLTRIKPPNPTQPSETPRAQVNVTNISANATEKVLTDFFAFCGDITSLELTADPANAPQQRAVVTFADASALQTALLLTNALIVDAPIHVEAAGDGGAAEAEAERAAEERAQKWVLVFGFVCFFVFLLLCCFFWFFLFCYSPPQLTVHLYLCVHLHAKFYFFYLFFFFLSFFHVLQRGGAAEPDLCARADVCGGLHARRGCAGQGAGD